MLRCPCLTIGLLFCTLTTNARAKDTWIEVRSPHFTVISNASDKEARKIADQFEQFREVFHATLPVLRLDLGKPLVIFAVRNEDSLKALIPAYWEEKGRAHPAGLYIPGEDRHYVAVRTDLEGENPYQIVYHEYTHAIMNLNFRGLPVWLNEGLAEYYANTVIEERYIEVGKVAPYHLQILQQQALIPVDQLLTADETSPYYNEANHASMFYAESWAIVHYLEMDPDARKRQLLRAFLTAWDATGNQLEAAQKAFGDLKKFADAMEAYARQRAFYVGKVATAIHGDPKSFSSRVLPPAEVQAQRALFYAHTRRPKEASAALDEALRDDPNLPLAYEAKGFLAYSQLQFGPAEAAFQHAIELGSNSFFPYYFMAQAKLRAGTPQLEELPPISASLEKAIQINAQFAPAYAALASLYSMNPATWEKAFAAGKKAVELEPGNLSYAINYGYVLCNAGKIDEAKTLALRIEHVAETAIDRANAQQLVSAIVTREELQEQANEAARQLEAQQQSTTTPPKTVNVPQATNPNRPPVSMPPVTPTDTSAPPPNPHAGETEYAVEGNIASADCAPGPGKVVLAVGKSSMSFRFADFSALEQVSTAKQDAGTPPPCANWKGRHVRLYFYKLKHKQFTGELNTIQFF